MAVGRGDIIGRESLISEGMKDDEPEREIMITSNTGEHHPLRIQGDGGQGKWVERMNTEYSDISNDF